MSRSPKTTLNHCPDEILLHIASHCTNIVVRNGYLANLALVSKRWRPIAQEWLIKRPYFNIKYIDRYIWELGNRPHLQRQVHTLEIWSESVGRVQYDQHGVPKRQHIPIPAPKTAIWGKDFVEMCEEVIAHFADDAKHKKRWSAALHYDVLPALFGVLLCALPNLKELKLGCGWLMDFPFFSLLLSPDILASYRSPQEWAHGFLEGPLQSVASRLEVLEIPTEMTALFFSTRVPTVFDLRRFQNLKAVGITQKALWWFPLRSNHPPDPREVFPPNLEVLRISEATQFTARTIENICTAKRGGHFPALRRIELYYIHNLDQMETMASVVRRPRPIDDMQRMFRDTELEVLMYFPGWELKTWEIQGTPWELKEEGVLKLAEQYALMKTRLSSAPHNNKFLIFEVEWDKDGDAVMI